MKPQSLIVMNYFCIQADILPEVIIWFNLSISSLLIFT